MTIRQDRRLPVQSVQPKHGGGGIHIRTLCAALGLAGVFFGTSCGATLPMTPSERTPAATGAIKVTKDSQGNTKLALKVDHLPRPKDLGPALSTFVVWSVADDGARVRNMGQLRINGDRQGSVDVVTPLRTFRLVITAEESGTVQQPSEYVILEGRVAPG